MAKESVKSHRPAEFLGLVSFAVALMLLISLASYDPKDPAPFFKTGENGPAQNFIGPFGAFLAELLIQQLFGFTALVLPLVLLVVGWRLFWCRPLHSPVTKVIGLGLLVLSVTGLLSLTLGPVLFRGEAVRAGGAVGELCAALLAGSFSRVGAAIVLTTSAFVSLILTTQFSFAQAITRLGGVLAERLRAARTAWAHYRETRRKERMRKEVLRKHAQKDANPGDESLPRVRKTKVGLPTPEQAPAVAPVLSAEEIPMMGDLDLGIDEEAPAGRGDGMAVTTPLRPKTRRAATPGDPAIREGLPPTTLLDEAKPGSGMDPATLFARQRTLQEKCREFGVLGTVTQTHPGPVVTTYEFKPDAGVKYSKVVGLADDLALALEAESIRIDRMSGRGTVGIEIPNEVRETIFLRDIVESDMFQKAPGRLTLALGKTVGGETYITDLATMPHLLIAGSTGTGKSVGLNCMIASILYKATPAECRMILIDPKRLELGVYEDIPHLMTPVVTDPKIAANVLKWAVTEMEKRIRTLAAEGVRNIDQFNAIVRAEKSDGEVQPLHYIVIIIDELADLMMVSSNEVEEAITRLAQMARAVGIHLILATQRPSVDVLTGLIKANFPSRISFRVAARVDSRTILDSIGAEHLLGKGDMLFLPPGSARLTRIHGAYVSEKEIARITNHLRTTGKPVYDDSVGKPERNADVGEVGDRDELFDEAVRFVVESGQASTSMLQRRFRVGFSRAGRLIDVMERDGIIGPADGSKAREILVPADYYATVDSWPK